VLENVDQAILGGKNRRVRDVGTHAFSCLVLIAYQTREGMGSGAEKKINKNSGTPKTFSYPFYAKSSLLEEPLNRSKKRRKR
jgi:hypothetical protein